MYTSTLFATLCTESVFIPHSCQIKNRSAPSQIVDAQGIARQRLRNSDSQRGIATLRSSTFRETAPKRDNPITRPNPSTSSTQPIPSYNSSYSRTSRENFNNNHNNTAYATTSSKDYKGKGVDRDRMSEKHQHQNAPPATKHAWQSRSSTNSVNLDVKSAIKDEYYDSFEEDDNPPDDGHHNHKQDSDDGYTEIPYKAIGNERNDDLTLVHKIKPGPKHFKPLASDPNFKSVEPNSKTRLRYVFCLVVFSTFSSFGSVGTTVLGQTN